MPVSVVKNDGGKGTALSLSRAAKKKNHKTSSDEEALSSSM